MAALLSGGAVHERLARVRETSSLVMVVLSTTPGGAEGRGEGGGGGQFTLINQQAHHIKMSFVLA